MFSSLSRLTSNHVVSSIPHFLCLSSPPASSSYVPPPPLPSLVLYFPLISPHHLCHLICQCSHPPEEGISQGNKTLPSSSSLSYRGGKNWERSRKSPMSFDKESGNLSYTHKCTHIVCKSCMEAAASKDKNTRVRHKTTQGAGKKGEGGKEERVGGRWSGVHIK